MADKPNLVHVEIFGQSYAVRAGTDPGYVEKLAAHVDEQMREVSRSSGAVDSLRIAVLAALNIADERFQAHSEGEQGAQDLEQREEQLEQREQDLQQRAARLVEQLDDVLGE